MSKIYSFDDGSSIEWIDKETLRYRQGECFALIWVDFEPGIFNSGRVLKGSSLRNWEMPEEHSEEIDADNKREIIAKVQEYYRSQNVKCRVEA